MLAGNDRFVTPLRVPYRGGSPTATRVVLERRKDRESDRPRRTRERPESVETDRTATTRHRKGPAGSSVRDEPGTRTAPGCSSLRVAARSGGGWGARAAFEDGPRGPALFGLMGSERVAQHMAETFRESGRGGCPPQQTHEIPVTVHVGPGREPHGSSAHGGFKVRPKGGDQLRRSPRKRRKRRPVELRTSQSDQVRSFSIGRRAQDRPVRRQLRHDPGPVDFMQGRTVVPHGNDPVVPRRKRIGEGVGESRAKVGAPLLRIVDLDDRKPTLRHRLAGMVVERFGDPLILGVVLSHEALVQPLPFRAATEKQNGGVRVGGTNGGPSWVRNDEC